MLTDDNVERKVERSEQNGGDNNGSNVIHQVSRVQKIHQRQEGTIIRGWPTAWFVSEDFERRQICAEVEAGADQVSFLIGWIEYINYILNEVIDTWWL